MLNRNKIKDYQVPFCTWFFVENQSVMQTSPIRSTLPVDPVPEDDWGDL